MSQIQRVEKQIELKSHADKLYNVWVRDPYLASTMCPTKHPKVELNKGEWNSVGSVLTWFYVLGAGDGERSWFTGKIEEIDEKNMSITYSMAEGEVLKSHYKSLMPKFQAIPKGDNSIVKWSIEFEKNNENAPEPNKYVEFLLSCFKDIDACLCNNQA